ncbi:hypothetical protein GCM10007928_01980 [Sulfitobacter porphyrae]|nr:hypothetical protein GCM10007928_01980 [Sulfitobacter porphyrae]
MDDDFQVGFFAGVILTLTAMFLVFIISRSSSYDACVTSTGAEKCVKEWKAVE